MTQTAVEWLLENSHIVPKNELNKRELIEQALEMEKQQIIDAFKRGAINEMNGIEEINSEQYYNEQFKKK